MWSAHDKFALTNSERDSVLLRVVCPNAAPQDQMFIDLAYAARVNALMGLFGG